MNKQKKERREEFLAAAKEIINTQGYEACTVRSICQRVGVAPSSFYNCFEDKDEAVFAAVSDISHTLVNVMEDVYIEGRICDSHSGSIRSGILLNNLRFAEEMP